MLELITALQYLDRQLTRSIDVTIEPVLLLEDIDAGSIRTWLRSALEATDDTGLKEGNWKKVVGTYLYKAKYLLINKLSGKTEISNREEIIEIEEGLLQLAEGTNVRRIPSYAPVPIPALLESIRSRRSTNSGIKRDS